MSHSFVLPLDTSQNCLLDLSVPPPNFFPHFVGQETPSAHIPRYTNNSNTQDDSNHSKCEITSWLEGIDINKNKKDGPKLNVSTVKLFLTKYLTLVKELERLLIYLKVGETSLSQSDWTYKCKEVENKKNELNKIADMFDDPKFMSLVEFVTRKAKKKRSYRKKMKQLWQERKNDSAELRARKHKRIDMWLEKMKSEVERVQREENVKREADVVLSGVNYKKSEAKRMLSMLNALTKLRNARAQQKLANRKYVSEEETKSFTHIIEKLKNFWTEQLKEYKQEETGLRLMLNDAEVERKNVELAQMKKITNQWNEALFGRRSDKLPAFLQLNSLDEHVAVRSSWDQFLSTDSLMASSIPVGWIIPVEPSSSEWAKYTS